MKTPLLSALGILALAATATAEPDPNWLEHDRDRPQPPVVDPGTANTADQPGRPPSDAVVLFNGSDTLQWVAMDGSPTKWLVHDGASECVPGSGFARETVFHNGVLVQNNVELTGPTSWLERAPYAAHPERTPIALQDHGNPVRYRNIWVRELGHYAHKEFRLADSVLETYVGDYPRTSNNVIHVARAPDGLLKMSFGGAEFLMHAESPTHFFALTNDVQCDFMNTDGRKVVSFTVGDWIAR
jgi:hypothetical protein